MDSNDAGLGEVVGIWGVIAAIFCGIFICPFRGHKLQQVQILWDYGFQCARCGMIDCGGTDGQ